MPSKLFRGFLVWGSLATVVVAACNGGSADPKKTAYPGDGDPAAGSGGTSTTKPGDGGTAGADAESEGGGGPSAGMSSNATGGAAAGSDGKSNDAGQFNGGDGGGAGGGGSPPWTPVSGGSGRGQTGPLVVQVTSAQSPAVVGQYVLYTITVGNASSVAVKGVNVLFRVPKGLEFVYTNSFPASSLCGNGYCTENEEATWDLGDIPAGAVRTIQLDPQVLDVVGEGDSVAPQVRVSAPDLDSVTLKPTMPVVASIPVEVTLGADADPMIPGDEVELSVDLGQVGEASLFSGKLALELPGWLEVTEVSDGGTRVAGDTEKVSWSIASLPVGASLRRLVKASVRSGAVAGDVLNPRATFTYEDAAVDNVAEFPIGIVAKAPPLKLRVEATADPVLPDGVGTYLVTVSNVSQRAVDGVTLYQRVPKDEVFIYSNVEPNSSLCGNGYCTDEELASWSLGTLSAGATETISIPAALVAQVAGDGTLVSSAFKLDAVGIQPQHRFKTIAAHAKPAAQLVLGTAYSPVVPGQAFTYDLDVGQIGPGSLQDSTLVLELPPEVVATTPSNGGTIANGVVSWSLGAIAVAQTAHRSVEVTVDAAATAGQILHARATLAFNGGQERDAVSEFALPLVSETPPLSVTLEASPSSVVLGDTVSYTTTIKNNAARTIDGVSLLLRVPPGYTFVYTTGADPDSSLCGNGYCTDYEEAAWTLGSIAAGATKIVNVVPTAAATLTAGTLTSFRQRLTAVDLGTSIMLQSTVPTQK